MGCRTCSSRNFSAHTGGDGSVAENVAISNLEKFVGGLLNVELNRVVMWAYSEKEIDRNLQKYHGTKLGDKVKKFLSNEVKVKDGFYFFK